MCGHRLASSKLVLSYMGQEVGQWPQLLLQHLFNAKKKKPEYTSSRRTCVVIVIIDERRADTLDKEILRS